MKITLALLLSMASLSIYNGHYIFALVWILPALFLLVLIIFEKQLLED